MLASVERQPTPPSSDAAWLLLAELNHRIGNELQAALAALQFARRGLGSAADPTRFIDDAAARLESFGDVHRLLDRQGRHGPLTQRLEALCRAVSRAKAAPLGIHITLKLDEVSVDKETAWTICVVASELMTNAFKHAFPSGLAGIVGVVLQQDAEEVVLIVADNGVGAVRPSAEAIWQAPGFGSGIVAQLADRLGGDVTRVGGPGGTSVTFRVPVARRMQ